MSASMESIIAAALASHQWYDATTDSEDPATGCTGCDDWFGDEDAVDDGTFAAHQARAVLAAISETSRPEFGVKGEDRVKPYGRDRRSAQLEARRRRATFVTRRVTAWTAVEG